MEEALREDRQARIGKPRKRWMNGEVGDKYLFYKIKCFQDDKVYTQCIYDCTVKLQIT